MIVIAMLVLGEELMESANIIETLDIYRPANGRAGYDIVKIAAEKLEDIEVRRVNGIVWMPAAIDANDWHISAWKPKEVQA